MMLFSQNPEQAPLGPVSVSWPCQLCVSHANKTERLPSYIFERQERTRHVSTHFINLRMFPCGKSKASRDCKKQPKLLSSQLRSIHTFYIHDNHFHNNTVNGSTGLQQRLNVTLSLTQLDSVPPIASVLSIQTIEWG
jgi:hypothetical protein